MWFLDEPRLQELLGLFPDRHALFFSQFSFLLGNISSIVVCWQIMDNDGQVDP